MLYLQNMNPGKGGLGAPYNSTTGIPEWFVYIGITLVVVVSVQVFLAIRKSKADGRTKAERETEALKQLVSHKFNHKPKRIK